MRHDLRLDGAAYRLRPVGLDDAEAIVALRAPGERTRFLHPTSPDPAVQRAWLERYFERPGDWYFAVERLHDGQLEGFIGIYNRTERDGQSEAEWGRWVLREGSLAGSESALLIYRMGFDVLHIDTLYSRTITHNAAVVSFHDRCNAASRTVLEGAIEFGGERFDAVEHRYPRETLPGLEALLGPTVTRVARRFPSRPA